MSGHRIDDQTELAQVTIEWCRKTETNGMIICLDQEKAYDRILHPFLWVSLKRFGFPRYFIETIKALYTNAQTKIILKAK